MANFRMLFVRFTEPINVYWSTSNLSRGNVTLYSLNPQTIKTRIIGNSQRVLFYTHVINTHSQLVSCEIIYTVSGKMFNKSLTAKSIIAYDRLNPQFRHYRLLQIFPDDFKHSNTLRFNCLFSYYVQRYKFPKIYNSAFCSAEHFSD